MLLVAHLGPSILQLLEIVKNVIFVQHDLYVLEADLGIL